MTVRERLHRLVEELPPSEVHTAERFLTYLGSASRAPLLRALLAAPEEGELETEDERAAAEEGRAALARGDVVSDEGLRRELSLGQAGHRKTRA